MENSTPHTKYTRSMLLILALVLLFASIIGYFASRRIQSNQNGAEVRVTSAPTVIPTLIPYPVKGQFMLKEKAGQKSVKLGSAFTIDVNATSSTDTVAGYDVVFSYDKTAFERTSVQSIATSFRIFPFERGNHLSISATKNLQVTEPIRFVNTPILSLSFVAKKKGTFTFSLKPIGNESSKLVNESAQVTYPETNDFLLEIN